MNNKDEPKVIEDSQLENVSGGGFGGGPVAHSKSFMERVKNFFGFGKKEESIKGNFTDEYGIYHINCIECGKEIKSWKPMPNSCYACGPQVCKECRAQEQGKYLDE